MSEQRQSQQRGQQSPLRSDRGRSTIENAAVSKIAGVAAQKVEKPDGRRYRRGRQRLPEQSDGVVTGGDSTGTGASLTAGVSVEVGEEEAAVDFTMAAEYGAPIPRTTEECAATS